MWIFLIVNKDIRRISSVTISFLWPCTREKKTRLKEIFSTLQAKLSFLVSFFFSFCTYPSFKENVAMYGLWIQPFATYIACWKYSQEISLFLKHPILKRYMHVWQWYNSNQIFKNIHALNSIYIVVCVKRFLKYFLSLRKTVRQQSNRMWKSVGTSESKQEPQFQGTF